MNVTIVFAKTYLAKFGFRRRFSTLIFFKINQFAKCVNFNHCF